MFKSFYNCVLEKGVYMKKILFLSVCLIFCGSVSYAGQVSSSCTYNGTPLYGRVKVVDSFEDFRVKRVDSFEDIKVKSVTSFPNSCGRWQFVDSFEDFRVKFVDSLEDFRVRFVTSFEGV